MTSVRLLWLVGIALFLASGGSPSAQSDVRASADVLKLTGPDGEALDATLEPMAGVIDRYEHDRSILSRFYQVPSSPVRRARLRELDAKWRGVLDEGLFAGMDRNGQVDFLLLRGVLDSHERAVVTEDARLKETATLVPFADAISALFEARQKIEPIDGRVAADRLNALKDAVLAARREAEKAVAAGQTSESRAAQFDSQIEEVDDALIKPTVANRAAGMVEGLRRPLASWYKFYHGYDPLFTWWTEAPFKALDKALDEYGVYLRERVAGVARDDRTTIVGDPVGRRALVDALALELIAYTPEELIAIGERELAWCEGELKKASREMGHGDDWKAALEVVKTRHFEPGEQPRFVKELGDEAIAFVEERALLTIPQLANDVWRMEMMSPEAQLQNPFFLGGESIIVAFPTNAMEHDAKLMSMRGNNRHFARATMFHELMPGHNLQQFMTSRYRAYRQVFGTPFWTEGWALYWEMRLWEMGFPKSPEDRIGMLFWRAHRGARILFSLKFHMEQMTAQECIDFLVDRVGHERANAEAEVRRSFQGRYSPLYQCAYLLGGLQFRALQRELVESGKMSERAFHDSVLKLGTMPVAMVRASFVDEELSVSQPIRWRFDDGASPTVGE